MAVPIPAQNVPLLTKDGLINPVWYNWMSQGGGATGGLPTGQVDGYVLGTNGTTASWLGFLQSGAGAIVRKWQDKMRDIVSVRDYGTTTTDFNNALSANGAALVPPGSYSASPTVSFDQQLVLSSGASVSSISSTGTAVRYNYNPSGMSWNASAGKTDKSGIFVDFGGYGPTDFTGNGLGYAIIGATKIPSSSTIPNHGAGISGVCSTYATATGAVGLYGQGDLMVAGGTAFGFNTRSQDNGNAAAQIWGGEIDVNVTNVNSTCVGLDVVGGSTVEPAVAIAYRVGALGAFSSPPKKWSQGMQMSDGSCSTAIEIGATYVSGNANTGGPPIQFVKRNGSGNRAFGGKIFHGGLALNVQLDDSSDFLRLKTDSATIAFQAQGTSIGFFGSSLAGKPNIVGSRSTQLDGVVNNLLNGLAAMGLVTNSTTP